VSGWALRNPAFRSPHYFGRRSRSPRRPTDRGTTISPWLQR
jgi:hypothetical protein